MIATVRGSSITTGTHERALGVGTCGTCIAGNRSACVGGNYGVRSEQVP